MDLTLLMYSLMNWDEEFREMLLFDLLCFLIIIHLFSTAGWWMEEQGRGASRLQMVVSRHILVAQ